METGNKPKLVKVAIDSLGCKLNQAEAELLTWQFAEAGYQLVSSPGEADIYILNTCTVTHIADRKSRHLLRLAHRRNPGAMLVATGCYVERAPHELSQIEGVSLVVGNEDKSHLRQILAESVSIVHLADEQQGRAASLNNGLRTRALVKVQDGCDAFCSYCIVPLVRGREQSLLASEVTAEIKQRIAQGYREVVLTGVEIGSYRDNGVSLKGLLERILDETGVERLRLSSLQPQDISTELIDLWHNPRLCPHFHPCLQSGSDSVLHRMRRRYATREFEQVVSLIRATVPEVAITTDVMVGFPGETEAEFAESLSFCRKMEFARIHVFSYSRRRGTEASLLPDQVSDKVKKERSQKMLKLAEESTRNFNQQFLGRIMPVLWEKQAGGIWSGLTGNYIKVYTRSGQDLTNKLLPVKLVEVYKDGMQGDREGIAEKLARVYNTIE